MRAMMAVVLLAAVPGCGGGESPEPEEDEGSYTQTLIRAYQGGFSDRTRGDMNAIGAALAMRMPDAGGYPVVTDIESLARELEPTYLRSVPRTDAWGRPFRYSSTGSGFTLASDGLDGDAGTADDIVLTDGGFR
jgi:hypothetical protein